MRNDTEQPIGLPNGDRLAINLQRKSTHPQYATVLQPTDPPVRANTSDVILMRSDFYLADNRWKESIELISYRVFQYWDVGPLDLTIRNLKRIKLYALQPDLPASTLADLLRCLSGHTAVEQLELDNLHLMNRDSIMLKFSALRLLSIGSIRVVTTKEQEAGDLVWPLMAILWVESPKLKTVHSGINYLGRPSIDFIDFCDCETLEKLHIATVPTDNQLRALPFKNLKVLIIDQYRHEHRWTILFLATGELLPRLQVLHCNYNCPDSTDFQLTPTECDVLRNLYDHLREELVQYGPIKLGLQIYIHGLQFFPARSFDACGFDRKLINLHYDNLSLGFHLADSLLSVTTVDYLDATETFLRMAPKDSLTKGIARFFQLYPNLRTVVVNNRSGRHLSSRLLITFLDYCVGLTELKLFLACLDGSFYEEMAELDSVQTLRSLVVLEKGGVFSDRIGFDFLRNQLRYLQKFHTNVVTRPVMFDILRTMQVHARFQFDYWIKSNTSYNRVDVCRTDLIAYQLTAQLRSCRDESSKTIYRKQFEDLTELEDYLTEKKRSFALHHWLDQAVGHNPSEPASGSSSDPYYDAHDGGGSAAASDGASEEADGSDGESATKSCKDYAFF